MAAAGNVQELKRNVTMGASVCVHDYDKRTPLHLAAAECKVKSILFLLASGADINAEDRWGGTPLEEALKSRKDNTEQVVELLFARGGKGKKIEDGTVIIEAAGGNDVAQLARLVRLGTNLEVKDYDGVCVFIF